MTASTNQSIELVPYEDRYKSDFRHLNFAWLEEFGLLESHDLEQLDKPESIIAPGGQIFLAREQDAIVGTCAIVRHCDGVVELAKLAVDPAARRRGIGRRLVLAAMQYARTTGATRIELVSNDRLQSSIKLYESLGFSHAPVPANTSYRSANVFMHRSLLDD